MITFGWRDASPDEAMELGLEQAGRFTWQLFEIGLFGFGATLCARVKV